LTGFQVSEYKELGGDLFGESQMPKHEELIFWNLKSRKEESAKYENMLYQIIEVKK